MPVVGCGADILIMGLTLSTGAICWQQLGLHTPKVWECEGAGKKSTQYLIQPL